VEYGTRQITPVFVSTLVSIQVPDHDEQSTLYNQSRGMPRFRTVAMETDGGRHFGIPAGLYAVGTRPHGGTVRDFEYDIVFQTSTTEAFCKL
jgi:hypothetical protein